MFGYSNTIVQNDLKELSESGFRWELLRGKNILVTGANGMLATYMIYTLMYVSRFKEIPMKVIALSRNKTRMETLFTDFLEDDSFVELIQDICEPVDYKGRIDYIFHFAGNASPYFIKCDPVGIMRSNLLGTFNVLELARQNDNCKLIFASTREVYGATDYDKLDEDSFGRVNPMENRSCYPESKRAAETLLHSYYLQYDVNSVIARIAHCYGPGMKLDNDGRVMSDFVCNAVHGENITLLSDGSAVRSFCYITDAVAGLLFLAFDGKSGEAYNLSNEAEPLPIREVALIIADIFPERCIKVSYKKCDDTTGYTNYKRVAMDLTKIEALGYAPKVALREGLHRTIMSFE